jgi:hypothetical protein
VATVKVGMATWKAIRSRRTTKDPAIQSSIELAFRKEWLHMNILGKNDVATLLWVKWEDETPTPKVGDLKSSGTPECLKFDSRGQNTSH